MSEEKKQLVPRLRFEEFLKSGSWFKNKLGDEVHSIIAGGDIDRKKFTDNGTYPVLANALINDGIIGYYKNQYTIKGPAVTVTGRGDIGHAKARNFSFTPVVRLLTIKSNHNIIFLENSINNYKSSFESTGVPQLTIPKLYDYELYFPLQMHEEEKIGNFFNTIDKMIQLQQSKVDKIKDIKAAYLSEMFPKEGEKYPKRRFEGFTEPWEEITFNEITEYITSFLSADKALLKGKYQLYDANEMIGYTNKSALNQEYITIIKDGSGVGRVRLLPKQSNFIGTMGAIINQVNHDIFYIYAYLQQFDFTEYITGATVPHVYYRDYGESSAYHPSLKEQQKIGEFFKNVDTQIATEEEKLAKLEKLKQAYLNDMFV